MSSLGQAENSFPQKAERSEGRKREPARDTKLECMEIHTFPMDGKLSSLKPLSRALSIIPEGIDVEVFTREGPDSPYRIERSEIYSPPLVTPFTKREAAQALNRMVQQKGRKLPKEAQTIQCKGHFYFHRPDATAALKQEVAKLFSASCPLVGDFLYPPSGYRCWHTNRYDSTGWAMYLIQVDRPGESFFRYIDPATGEMKTRFDEPDTVNFFRIDKKQHLWHCIASESALRWSQGFTVPDDWALRLGLQRTALEQQ